MGTAGTETVICAFGYSVLVTRCDEVATWSREALVFFFSLVPFSKKSQARPNLFFVLIFEVFDSFWGTF
jgi:hypothetical protein